MLLDQQAAAGSPGSIQPAVELLERRKPFPGMPNVYRLTVGDKTYGLTFERMGLRNTSPPSEKKSRRILRLRRVPGRRGDPQRPGTAKKSFG